MKTFDDFHISPPGSPNDGFTFADHSAQRRSLVIHGHALLECKNVELLAYYPKLQR